MSLHPSQERLVKTVQAEFERVTRDIAGRCPPELITINAAQNALRTCIEAVLNKTVPYESSFLVELAVRVASYTISAAPMEDQEILVAQFMSLFADAHLRRISEGKVISSQWQMNDGRTQSNFPEARK
jgi:hypothetical protein